jgi:hypothetical protein
MRYLIAILIAIISLSCQNKENEMALNAIKQNNELLTNEIETLKAIMYNHNMDYPKRYDSIYTQKLNEVIKNALQLKNKSEYHSIYRSIDSLTKAEKFKLSLHPTASENIDIQKNNLLLQLHALFNVYLNSHVLKSFHHDYSRMLYLTDSDSVNLYFIRDNPYIIMTDSIVDGQHKNLNFSYKKDILIGKIKYKTDSKKSKFYGKLFYNDEGKPIFLQNFEQEINKQKNFFQKSDIETN